MQAYHTSLKICYALGIQKQLVDKAVQNKIPHSTIHYWRKNVRPEKYIGTDTTNAIQQHLANIQNALHPANAVPLKIFSAYCKIVVTVVNMLDKTRLLRILRKSKETFINLLDKYAEYISYQKVSRYLGISLKTLYHWRTQIKFKCDHSALLLCSKRHPNQATLSEVNVLKKWLLKKEYNHWGVHSVWAEAFKKSETALSKQSWYHYNKLLKIRLYTKKGKKPYKDSLRASQVNQIWHADITVFKTLDGVKHYIYTVMDNYSRFIHAWHIDAAVSAEKRLKTIKDALKNAFGEKIPENLQLVTDGGPENDNLTLKAFIQNTTINHTIALQDIVQSNSMMEAFYHTAKYRYLYLKTIQNKAELHSEVEKMINEYHTLKPHYALGIYTPQEVLNGADVKISHRNIYAEAAKKRREINKNANCSQKCQ